MSARKLTVRLDVTGLGDRAVAKVLAQMEAAGFTIRVTRTIRRDLVGVGPVTATTASLTTVIDVPGEGLAS